MAKRHREWLVARDASAALVLTAGVLSWEIHAGSAGVDSLLSDERKDLYLALATAHAALLGFLIAAIAIVAAALPERVFDALRKKGFDEELWDHFLEACWMLGVAMLAALAALALDHSHSPNRYALALCAGTSATAWFRLGRAVTMLDQLVRIISGRPGQETD